MKYEMLKKLFTRISQSYVMTYIFTDSQPLKTFKIILNLLMFKRTFTIYESVTTAQLDLDIHRIMISKMTYMI